MNEAMNETLSLVLETADRLFERHCSREVRDAVEQGQWPEALWRAIRDAGLDRALLPEHQGGAGLDWAQGLAVIDLAGYHAVPVPLPETLLALRLLADADVPVPAGPVSLVPWSPGPMLQAEPTEEGWRLSGVCRRVPWGGKVQALVAQVDAGNEVRLVCFDPSRCDITSGANMAGEPRDLLRLDGVQVPAEAVFNPGYECDLFALGALMRARQLAGAMQKVLDQTVRYAGERTQFGRPISKFQAIQQQLAVMAGEVAAAQAIADEAVDHWGADKSDFFVAAAKARTGEAAGKVAAIAHQVHGAMGFTREHSLHETTRRLWSWRDEFGNESFWQRRLGRQVLAVGAEQLWPYLAEPSTVPKEG